MKYLSLIILLLPLVSFAKVKTEGFIIQLSDRSVNVLSPQKKSNIFSVIIENKSLSDQVGKFSVGEKILKFVSVKSGKSESLEIENKTSTPVVFIPMSPAFQEIPLYFGKKAYEIPSKE
jgi:hypothetical protein